jgi:hypothetical protein
MAWGRISAEGTPLRDHEGLPVPTTTAVPSLERDPSGMRNDINRLASELQDLDPLVVERLYQNLLLLLGRRPGLQEARAYIAELRVTMDERMLRGLVCLPPVEPPTKAQRAGGPRRPASIVVAGTRDPGRPATRGPGRPSWTRELFWERYRDACARTSPPHTYRSIAPQFLTLDGHRGADPEYVRKLVRRFGPPPDGRAGGA